MTNEPDRPDETPEVEPGAGTGPSTEGASTQSPPGSAAAAPPERKRLMRSRSDEWFGGVAGGVAEYFDTDPTLIRVAFVLAAVVTSGFAVIAYIVAWIVIPEEPATAEARRRRRSSGNTAAILWGGILIIGGVLFLLAQLDLDIDLPSWRVGLSAALIFVGVLMLVEARHGFHGGLVSLAVILTVLLGLSTAGNFNFAVDGAFGESTHVVTNAEELQGEYSHIFGSLTVDLSDLDPPAGTTNVQVNVVFGEATVDLPEGVPYRIEADSVFGNIDSEEFDTGGIATGRTFTSPGYGEADRRINIEMSVVFGSGRIR